MPFYQNIPMLCILLTMAGGAILPLVRRGELALRLSQVALGLVAALSAVLLWNLDGRGAVFVYTMGHFPAPWGNELRGGPLEALLALAFSMVMLLSLTGGAQDLRRDIRPERQSGYCLLIQLLLVSLLVMIYTNDLFTAYVFMEISAIAACMVVAAKESGLSVVSAIRYLVFNCLGSGLFLLGVAVLYCITGHLLMPDLSRAVAALSRAGGYALPLTGALLLMALGLAVKSAQFPFQAWLPDAHGSATTSASAILSGLVLKGYLVLMMKIMVRVMGLDLLMQTYVADLFLLLGLTGMIAASAAALWQEDVKRMIAYSSSAQISYIFLAFGLGTRAGLVAACYQILAHAVTKPMIFVGAGAMIRASGGRHNWGGLRGAARRDPVAGLAFTIGGLSLCGLPLLAGFSAKYALAAAAIESRGRMAPALLAIAVSSVLNALYYMPAILAIWGEAEGRRDSGRDSRWGHQAAIVLFLGLNLLLGVGLGPMTRLLRRGIWLF